MNVWETLEVVCGSVDSSGAHRTSRTKGVGRGEIFQGKVNVWETLEYPALYNVICSCYSGFRSELKHSKQTSCYSCCITVINLSLLKFSEYVRNKISMK